MNLFRHGWSLNLILQYKNTECAIVIENIVTSVTFLNITKYNKIEIIIREINASISRDIHDN